MSRISFSPAGLQEVVVHVGGRLAGYKQEWQKVTKDPFFLNCIKGYKIGFDQTPNQKNLLFSKL